jgi:hypothetical protein
MAGFLYYIAGVTDSGVEPVRSAVRACGLNYAFGPKASLERVCCQHGPDGGGGLIVGDTRRTAGVDVGHYPEKQVWRRIPENLLAQPLPNDRGSEMSSDDSAAVWVGHVKGQPPGPADLIRADALPGTAVKLGDGNEWRIPAVRAWVSVDGAEGWTPRLPRQADLGDDGVWKPGAVLPAYAELSRVAAAWWDELVRAGSEEAAKANVETSKRRVELNFDDGLGAAVAVLAANYAIGPVETAMLGLLNGAAAADVLNAAVDWPTFCQWLEKKTAAVLTPAG